MLHLSFAFFCIHSICVWLGSRIFFSRSRERKTHIFYCALHSTAMIRLRRDMGHIQFDEYIRLAHSSIKTTTTTAAAAMVVKAAVTTGPVAMRIVVSLILPNRPGWRVRGWGMVSCIDALRVAWNLKAKVWAHIKAKQRNAINIYLSAVS